MDSKNNDDQVAALLGAFAAALEKRDHEALDVQLAPWITVDDALTLANGQEFDVFIEDRLFPEVAERLPARVDEHNYVAWAILGDFEVAIVEIAGSYYVGYFGRD